MRLTRSIYNAVFGLVVFAALNVAAAPQVAVYRNWDNVQVNRLDIVDFGETESNVPISRLFRIENHGNTTMNVNVSLDTPNQKSVGYSIIEFPAPTVAPGGSTTFRIRFQFSTDGRWFGYVNVNTDDPVTPLFQFSTSGTVHGPFIYLYENSTFNPQPSGSTWDYGTIPAGTVTSTVWQIQNRGSRTLTITNSTTLVSGAGFFEIVTPSASIAPGTTSPVRVRFAPTSPGTAYSGQISIQGNDTAQSPWVIFLTGHSN